MMPQEFKLRLFKDTSDKPSAPWDWDSVLKWLWSSDEYRSKKGIYSK